MISLPSQEQCLNYFEEYKVPKNIKKHCMKVQEIAVFLAKKLNEAGIMVDVEMVRAGAILHDLFKIAAIKDLEPNKFHTYQFTEEELEMRSKLIKKFPGMYENEIAYEIFKDDFPQLALTIKREGDPHNNDKTWEEKIINYADTRIFKEEIVTLDERFSYLVEKYKAPVGFWENKLNEIKEQEDKIFSIIGLDQNNLKEEMEKGKL
jgi:uncharacterized protein